MPQFESEPTLSVVYTQAQAGQEYDYSGLSLIDALTDASQVQVRWSVTTVYIGGVEGVGTAQPVNELPVATQEAIYVLDETTQYTVDPDGDTITIVPAGIENQSVTVGSGTYFYPASFTITPAQNLELRRSTDVTTKVVNFQPGGRLTAEQLNLSTSQSFNAIQELTQFGVGAASSIGDVDLSLSSINDLGDVNLTVNGLLGWDGATVTSGTSAGILVPDPTLAQGGMVLSKKDSPYSGDPIEWKFSNTDDVLYAGTGTYLTTVVGTIETNVTNLQNKTTGFTRNAGSVLTTFSDSVAANAGLDVNVGNVVVFGGDVDVKTGDILIQGESVYDAITSDIHRSYLQLSCSGLSVNVTTGAETNLQASNIRSSLVKIAGPDFVIDEANDTNIALPSAGVYKIDVHIATGYGTPAVAGNLVRRVVRLYSTPSGGGTSTINPSFPLNEIRDSGGTVGDKVLSGSWMLSVNANHTISLALSNPGGDNGILLSGYTLIITKVA